MGEVEGQRGEPGPAVPDPASQGRARGDDDGIDWARMADLDDAVGRDVVAEIVAVGLDEVPAMLAALREATGPDLAGRAHALKSVAGNLGMSVAFERCQAIESAARSGDHAAARAMLPALEDAARRALDALRAAYGPGGA